jgi:Tol biopolymer transport system component
MKQKMLVANMVLAALVTAAAEKSPESMLGAALHQEEAQGDLKGAIAAYQKVLATPGVSRKTAAEALVRMGQCYEKLGDAESRKAYERVLREYADQKEAVAAARARLGSAKTAATGKSDRPVWTGPEVDIFGRISPDGRYLTYVDWFETGNLMIHDMVTGKNHSLTKKKSWEDSPGYALWSSISPDGKQVAYAWANNQKDFDLLVAALQGTAIGEPRILLSSKEIHSIRPFEWSKDCKWIAVQVERADSVTQIGLLSVQDGTLRVLRSVDWRGTSNVAFSPDGRYIAYDLPESDTTQKRDVFTLAVDGSRGTTLVANSADDSMVGFSRDGQLLFSSDRTGSQALWAQQFVDGKVLGSPVNVKPDFGSPWIHGVTASGALYITKAVSDSDVYIVPFDLRAGKLAGNPVGVQRFPSRGHPDWSPDSKFLAFVDCGSSGDGPCTILIRNVQTGAVHDLRPALQYLAYPRWSPDARSFLAGGRDLKGRRGLFLIDAASGETSLVSLGSVRRAVWSPDGRKIYYGHRDGKVLERELASGKERALFSFPKDAVTVTFSPDGRLAAYVRTSSALILISAENGESREVWTSRPPESIVPHPVLCWTPDSRALIMTKKLTTGSRQIEGPRELWLVPVTGDSPRKLDIDVSEWDILNGDSPRLSPDGRQIAYMAGKRSLEVWALEGSIARSMAKR